jgi:hypothetical protein
MRLILQKSASDDTYNTATKSSMHLVGTFTLKRRGIL